MEVFGFSPLKMGIGKRLRQRLTARPILAVGPCRFMNILGLI